MLSIGGRFIAVRDLKNRPSSNTVLGTQKRVTYFVSFYRRIKDESENRGQFWRRISLSKALILSLIACRCRFEAVFVVFVRSAFAPSGAINK